MLKKNYTKRAPISSKTRFNNDDDRSLMDAVNKAIEAGSSFSNLDWGLISHAVPGKNSRQCRERWQNYLDPSLTDKEWTNDEDAKLMSLYQNYSQMWTQIARFLPGRTGNSVRNRYMKLNRRQTKIKQIQYRVQIFKRSYPYLAKCDWEHMIDVRDKQKTVSKPSTLKSKNTSFNIVENATKKDEELCGTLGNLEDRNLYWDCMEFAMDSFFDLN